jgi:hypothetical protein
MFFFKILIIFSPILVCYFIIPNRKFKEVSENEIDEKIKILNSKGRLSFNYRNVKVSLKRVNNKLLIEPYSNKIIELLFRIIGFILSFLIIIILLTLIGTFLNSINFGDTDSGGDFVRRTNWNAFFENSIQSFAIIYFVIFYFSGKYFRKKILNKLLIKKHKNDWDEFCLKYAEFRY